MIVEDLEREYLQEFAYIKAQKDAEDWQQWEEEQRRIQKPAKIEVVYEGKNYMDKSKRNTNKDIDKSLQV